MYGDRVPEPQIHRLAELSRIEDAWISALGTRCQDPPDVDSGGCSQLTDGGVLALGAARARLRALKLNWRLGIASVGIS